MANILRINNARLPTLREVVLPGLSVLLLIAAGLKLAGGDVSGLPQVGWFSAPWLQTLAIEWEIVLGVWLVSRRARRLAWVAALITFAVFAAVSGYLGWNGVADCGCFGTIKASPWWAFGIDLSALAALLMARPVNDTVCPESDRGHRQHFGTYAVVVGIFLIGGTVSVGYHGSTAGLLAAVRGKPLVAEPSVVDLGEGKPGRRLDGTVTISNCSQFPVRLTGGTTDCSCATTEDLPATIPPGGEVRLRVRVSVNTAHVETATQRAWIWTDTTEQPVLKLILQYRVGPPDTVSVGAKSSAQE